VQDYVTAGLEVAKDANDVDRLFASARDWAVY
jgi:hypothetical protein